jgi:hypothetical protein
VWPLVPATALIGFGLFLQGFLSAWPFEQFVWLAAYWPVAIIAIGAWLLLRDQVPATWRAPVAVIGASALILVGFLVAAAGIATVAGPMGRFTPVPAFPAFQTMPMFGTPPIQDTVYVSGPIAPGETLRVANTSGRTIVRATTGDQVRVEAVRHYWSSTNPPDVRLVPGGAGVTVQSTPPFFGPGNMGYIDYVIDVPAAAGADITSASGDITVSGLQGGVTVRNTSGNIGASDLSGDTRLTTVSGGIRGTNVDRVREARTTSGGIDLSGAFSADAAINSISGGVTLQFEPGASVRVDAGSMSGGISSVGPGMPRTTSARDGTFTLGSGTAQIQVRTTSGGITLTAR